LPLINPTIHLIHRFATIDFGLYLPWRDQRWSYPLAYADLQYLGFAGYLTRGLPGG